MSISIPASFRVITSNSSGNTERTSSTLCWLLLAKINFNFLNFILPGRNEDGKKSINIFSPTYRLTGSVYRLNSRFKQTHNLLFSTLSFSSSSNDGENKKELPAKGCIWK